MHPWDSLGCSPPQQLTWHLVHKNHFQFVFHNIILHHYNHRSAGFALTFFPYWGKAMVKYSDFSLQSVLGLCRWGNKAASSVFPSTDPGLSCFHSFSTEPASGGMQTHPLQFFLTQPVPCHVKVPQCWSLDVSRSRGSRLTVRGRWAAMVMLALMRTCPWLYTATSLVYPWNSAFTLTPLQKSAVGFSLPVR